jgi:hypothetical protein
MAGVVLSLGDGLDGWSKNEEECALQPSDGEISQNGRPVKASVKVRKSLEVVCTIAGQDDRILEDVESDSSTFFVVARASVEEDGRLTEKVRRREHEMRRF